MTGNDLAKRIRRHTGKVYVMMHLPNDTMPVAAEKKDLAAMLSEFGDRETGMEFDIVGGQARIDREFGTEV